VTPGTAANHVAAILTRVGVVNRTQVATWAIGAGLLDDESRV
jgi:DNA-binding NarL/FixJ family response regulator